MNVFEELLLLPGAAPILADKLSGRIIGRVAQGFGEDEALQDMMDLFRAIENKWPQNVMSIRAMFELQLSDAAKETAVPEDLTEGLTAEQKAMWESEPTRTESRVTKLKNALPKIIDLYTNAKPNSSSWDNLTTINKWSLLNAIERSLQTRLVRYTTWAAEDEAKGKTESKAITALQDAEDASLPLFDLITNFLEDPDVKEDLELDASIGIRVPIRQQA